MNPNFHYPNKPDDQVTKGAGNYFPMQACYQQPNYVGAQYYPPPFPGFNQQMPPAPPLHFFNQPPPPIMPQFGYQNFNQPQFNPPNNRFPNESRDSRLYQPRRDSRKSRSRSRNRSRAARSRSRSRSRSRMSSRTDSRSNYSSRHSYHEENRRCRRAERRRSRSRSRDVDRNTNTAQSVNEKVSEMPSTVQTTLIPIYYMKDQDNPKLIKSSAKLNELCTQFEDSLIARSRQARQKANRPIEATQIPDYRKLLLTKKFDNYTRCTCDHDKSSQCGKHRGESKKKNTKSSSSSSSSSSDSESGSSSSSVSSSASGSSRSSSSDSSKSSDTKRKLPKKKDHGDEHEDIRSMEINRKLNHPERLHPELIFNEPDQTNEGPLCKCKLKTTTFGTRHQIYYGEKRIEPCNEFTNNYDRLFHYRMSIEPSENFTLKNPTKIVYDKHDYVFEGFSIFSHEPLENIPNCLVVIFNHEYKLNIVKEDFVENFTVKELELLKRFLFEEILELYDLKWKGYNIGTDACDRFHIMPRFCRTLPYNGKELLSPSEIIKYLIENSGLVVSPTMLAKCHIMSNREWLNYIERIQGTIVTNPGRRPASIRIDQLDRDEIVSLAKHQPNQSFQNKKFPLIIHFSMFRNNWLPLMKNNKRIKKLYQKYFKFRHLINNKTKPSVEDKAKLRALDDELQEAMKKSSDVQKEIMIELSSENFCQTGIRADLVQQAVLVPTFIEHLRFHLSLKFLEEKIGYQFKNRLLLQYALTHPSGAFMLHQNLGANPDHVRNALFNCRLRNPNYGVLTPQKRKNLLRKKGIHMLFTIMAQKAQDNEESSSISNYERLEFLGDKILELLISKHLFLMFPMFDEGQLSEYRNTLVQNQYLAVLARKLNMHYFIIFYHGIDLCSNSALNHALANSYEALLAAIYLDSDLETVSSVLGKTLWHDEDTMDLYEIWNNLPMHPIQAQMPNGDRHLIASTKILQHVQLFEESIGVQFKHIRLLAQAFCTRSVSFNLITLGDNQRLEFLGDSVLNFVVSDYLYRFFPNHHEGHLSLLRSSLVCNSTQALLFDEIGMGEFVLTSYINNKQELNGNLKRKADVFEAIVGALFLDQGLEAISVFCHVCMFNKLEDIIMLQFWNDPKSRLQQCCLSLRDVDDSRPSLPTYKLIEEKGPPNNKIYRVVVYFNRKRIGEGSAKSIHDAEVEAAKNALKTKSDMFPILNKYVSREMTRSVKTNDERACERIREISYSTTARSNRF